MNIPFLVPSVKVEELITQKGAWLLAVGHSQLHLLQEQFKLFLIFHFRQNEKKGKTEEWSEPHQDILP